MDRYIEHVGYTVSTCILTCADPNLASNLLIIVPRHQPGHVSCLLLGKSSPVTASAEYYCGAEAVDHKDETLWPVVDYSYVARFFACINLCKYAVKLPLCIPWKNEWGYSSAMGEMSGQLPAPVTFTPGWESSAPTEWEARWGPELVCPLCRKDKSFAPVWNRTTIPRPTILQPRRYTDCTIPAPVCECEC